jgi:hypothetical protein
VCIWGRLTAGRRPRVPAPHHQNPARHIPSVICVAPPEDEQVMLQTCRDP